MFVVRALRGLLKIRYILLGGAVGGGVTLQKVQTINALHFQILTFSFDRNIKIGKKVYLI